MAINFPNSPSVNDIHVSGANRWQWNGSSWTRIGGVNSDSDTINSTNDNSTTTLYPVMVSGTGDQTAKIATTANKNLKFNAAEGDLTVGGDISGINANLTGILTASQYNSITAPGANITGVATALQLKGPLTSSGINVTGVSTFSGNLSVGGVLTYEDVKNVDSIGLGTFRNGVVVKTGTATTALIVEGDARITGILTVGTGSLVITDKDINATGIITGSNFKSGTTNVHNVGVEAAGINVLGADTPIGTGATVYNSGLFVGKQGAEFQGVVTASSFKGSGADLTDVISGIGIGTEGGVVGYAATIVHFKGPGVTTAYYSATTGVGTVYFTGGGGSASVSISETAPSSPSAGDMWWDSDVGNLQIYYTDANSSQWVTANNSGPQGPQGAQGAAGTVGAQGAQGRQGSVGIASLTISATAPSSPAQGDMWWESDTGNLGLYYNDGNSSQWVNINAGPAGAQGAAGAQGSAGAQGAQGRQGATGAAGAQGAQGHQGVQGATGPAPTSGGANFTSEVDISDGTFLDFGNGGLKIRTNSNNAYITEGTSGKLAIQGSNIEISNSDGDENYIYCTDDGAVDLFYNGSKKLETTNGGITVTGKIFADSLDMGDNERILIGASDDLMIYHDASHSRIKTSSSATGNLVIDSNNDINLRVNDSEMSVHCKENGAVELYYDNTKKFETTADGIEVTGKIFPSSHIDMADNIKLLIGTGDDLQIFHDGGSSIIRNTNDSASLYIQASSSGTNNIRCYPNGSTQLFHNGNLKLYTDSAGIRMNDDLKIDLGSNSDFKIYHDAGGWNQIVAQNDHPIQIKSASTNMIKAIPGAACEIYHNNARKFITETTGTNVTGRTTWTGGSSAETQSVYLAAGSNNPTQIGMFNGHGAKQGFCFYNNGSSSYTSWGMITDQQNWYLKTAAYNIGNTSDLSSNWTNRLEVSNGGVFTVNPGGRVHVRGGTTNGSQDTVVWIDKQNNNDWCLKVEPGTGSSTDYGIYVRANNSASYGFALHNLTTWKFRVAGNGTIYSSNTSIQSISDVRLKENIVDANSQWDDIKALRFRNFKWKADSGHADGITYLGLIAQEVEPISPNLVEIDAQDKEDKENGVPDPEYKNVKYSIVWMKAVKALQEAQARIETLEAEVAALKSS